MEWEYLLFTAKKAKAMTENLVATSTITIDAPASRVWDVITDPAAVKEFMFGADLETDWTVGGPILWRGEWEGKPYEDKGTSSRWNRAKTGPHPFQPARRRRGQAGELSHPDVDPGRPGGRATKLTLSQDNNATEEAAEHSKGMWDMLVADVKKIAERG